MIYNSNNIILGSIITPQFNGNRKLINKYNFKCTDSNKWAFTIILGLLFFVLSNSLTMYIFINILNKLIGKPHIPMSSFPGLIYNILMTIIFIVIVRLIL